MTYKAAEVYDALMIKAGTLAIGSPPLPIDVPEPDVVFTPPADGKYLSVTEFPNRPRWEGLSSGVLDQGLLQITVVWPKNAGLYAPKVVAGQVIAHFAKGTVMVSTGGVKVRIVNEPWTASPLTEGSELRLPVTIPWQA